MCTININTLEIDRQVFWQIIYTDSEEKQLSYFKKIKYLPKASYNKDFDR